MIGKGALTTTNEPSVAPVLQQQQTTATTIINDYGIVGTVRIGVNHDIAVVAAVEFNIYELDLPVGITRETISVP
jgi:hypothetical protein